MGLVTSTIQQLADRIVDYEAQLSVEPLPKIDVVLRVCEKLHLHLVTLVGKAGYHALMTRTLALLQRDYPWAKNFRIQTDGSILPEISAGTHTQVDSMMNEAVAIPAQLLTLLAIFIGEHLTLNLALEIWPPLASKAEPTKIR